MTLIWPCYTVILVKPLQFLLLFLAALYLFFSAALDLRAHLAYRSLQDVQESSSSSSSRSPGMPVEMRREATELAAAATKVARARPEAFLALAALKRAQGENQADITKRINSWCESLASLGQALKLRPSSSQLLINWANLRQLLGVAPCPQEFTQGDISEVAGLAMASGSNNTAVVYAAALIAYWNGEKERSLDLFHRYLTYAVSPTDGQLQLVRSAIRTGQDFKAVVPARFPQITTWLRLIEQYGPKPQQLEPELGQVVVAALNQNRQDYEQGRVDAMHYFTRVTELNEAHLSNPVRKLVDDELAQFVQNGESRTLADYLTQRSKLDELKIVPSVVVNDSKPTNSSLASWATGDSVALDNSRSSIGFYLAPQQNVKIIELNESSNKSELVASMLRVYCSEDNEKWAEMSDVSSTEFKLNRDSIVAFRVGSSNCKYYKVHYDSGGHESTFRNELGRIIKAYGYSTIPN